MFERPDSGKTDVDGAEVPFVKASAASARRAKSETNLGESGGSALVDGPCFGRQEQSYGAKVLWSWPWGTADLS